MALTYAIHSLDENGHQAIQTYEGFCVVCSPHTPPEGAEVLCCVMNEGDPDWWWLEGRPKVGLDNLRQYYEKHETWVQSFNYRLFQEVHIDALYAKHKGE